MVVVPLCPFLRLVLGLSIKQSFHPMVAFKVIFRPVAELGRPLKSCDGAWKTVRRLFYARISPLPNVRLNDFIKQINPSLYSFSLKVY